MIGYQHIPIRPLDFPELESHTPECRLKFSAIPETHYKPFAALRSHSLFRANSLCLPRLTDFLDRDPRFGLLHSARQVRTQPARGNPIFDTQSFSGARPNPAKRSHNDARSRGQSRETKPESGIGPRDAF